MTRKQQTTLNKVKRFIAEERNQGKIELVEIIEAEDRVLVSALIKNTEEIIYTIIDHSGISFTVSEGYFLKTKKSATAVTDTDKPVKA